MLRGYQIIHHKKFDSELTKVAGTIQKGDELVRGVEWVVSRDPFRGELIAKNIYYFKMANDDLGRIFVFYTVDESKKKVYLISIKHF